MTLIVTAMIGDYSIMAADRKQSIHPDFDVFSFFIPKPEDTTKIILHNGVAFTGSGNSLILDRIKSYYKSLIDININEIVEDKSTYFESVSDFKGLNFAISMVITDCVFLNVFHFQNDDKYLYKAIRSDVIYDSKFKIVILPPSDVDYSNIFNYCQLEFSKLISYNENSIVVALKKIFRKISNESKYVSSDFDVVFLPLYNGHSICNIKN